MATAAERWEVRRTRRLVREAARLAEDASRFVASLEKSRGPYGNEAESLAAKTVTLVRLASQVDGMRDVNETTEEA